MTIISLVWTCCWIAWSFWEVTHDFQMMVMSFCKLDVCFSLNCPLNKNHNFHLFSFFLSFFFGLDIARSICDYVPHLSHEISFKIWSALLIIYSWSFQYPDQPTRQQKHDVKELVWSKTFLLLHLFTLCKIFKCILF